MSRPRWKRAGSDRGARTLKPRPLWADVDDPTQGTQRTGENASPEAKSQVGVAPGDEDAVLYRELPAWSGSASGFPAELSGGVTGRQAPGRFPVRSRGAGK